jgi:predicted oxidoreductase
MSVSRIELMEDEIEVSRLVPGLMRLHEWGLSSLQIADWIKACVDMGLTTFDHADIYGGYTCEALFGEALANKSYLRGQIQLISKCGIKLLHPNRPQHRLKSYDTSAEHILQSVENSLRNLRTDYLDLLLIHRPDPLMDADEIAEVFMALWESGKVLYFGVSNFTNTQFSLLDSRLTDFDLVTNQVEFSVSHLAPMHDGTFDWLQMLSIVPMVWSPLGGGGLFKAESEKDQRIMAALRQVGEELGGAAADQVALAFVLQHPSRPVPVLGTGKLERLKSAAAAEKLVLSREQWFMIWEASQGHRVP